MLHRFSAFSVLIPKTWYPGLNAPVGTVKDSLIDCPDVMGVTGVALPGPGSVSTKYSNAMMSSWA